MRSRSYWRRRHDRLDPETDFREISINLATYEFPWDTLQALSFALFRTYAVPSIGVLLHDTGEFTERVQKRYDDTGLLLEEVLEHGLTEGRGRDALRRINQIHGRYDISNDDMLYVLATFVVMPKRWHDQWSYRPLTHNEVVASVNYYVDLGRHMGIKGIPTDYAGFDRLLEDYETAHFAYDARARKVADSTLDLFTTFPLNRLAPPWLLKRFAYSLMDDRLRAAFGYPRPTALECRIYHALLRLRGRFIALLPARSKQKWARDMGNYRSYPQGYDVAALGTFPSGCPVHVSTGADERVAG